MSAGTQSHTETYISMKHVHTVGRKLHTQLLTRIPGADPSRGDLDAVLGNILTEDSRDTGLGRNRQR